MSVGPLGRISHGFFPPNSLTLPAGAVTIHASLNLSAEKVGWVNCRNARVSPNPPSPHGSAGRILGPRGADRRWALALLLPPTTSGMHALLTGASGHRFRPRRSACVDPTRSTED